ncbi:DUF2235 domain-containing protein [Epibacterium sp. DP7N7-1]|nr:DUF2235 domain-containing protein [Epibacterium sp. DP7N7-1]
MTDSNSTPMASALDEAESNDASGNASIDAVETTCPKLTIQIGCFFEGTSFNGRNTNLRDRGLRGAQTGRSWDSEAANTYKLFTAYPSGTEKADCGSVVGRRVSRFYIGGVGTRDEQSDVLDRDGLDIGSPANGIEDEGVRDKLDEAHEALDLRIDEAKFTHARADWENVEEIIVDVFGWSRGAATARVFANEVLERYKIQQGLPLRIRAIGLFDTVFSIGLDPWGRDFDEEDAGGEETAGFNRNIHLKDGDFEHAFQLQARDEYRDHFPLRRIDPGQGIGVWMPGDHQDVGGGSSHDTGFKVLSSNISSNGLSGDELTELRARGFPIERRMGEMRDLPGSRPGPRQLQTIEQGFDWKPGLDNVALHAMHQFFQDKLGNDFLDIEALTSNKKDAVPDDLTDLPATLAGGSSVSEGRMRTVRADGYVSTRSTSIGMGADENFVREEAPNQP